MEIERLEFKRVKYYSIAFEDHNSEFLDFQQRMRQSHKTQLGELVTLLYEIGELYGAKTNFFRDERKADALPPESFQYLGQDDQDPENPYGLRLYCLRITESIVILLNGDLKTAEKVDDCENCKRHFQLANKVATKIEEAIREKWITHNGKQLIDIDSFEFEI